MEKLKNVRLGDLKVGDRFRAYPQDYLNEVICLERTKVNNKKEVGVWNRLLGFYGRSPDQLVLISEDEGKR